jgi:hypothetical protein
MEVFQKVYDNSSGVVGSRFTAVFSFLNVVHCFLPHMDRFMDKGVYKVPMLLLRIDIDKDVGTKRINTSPIGFIELGTGKFVLLAPALHLFEVRH